MATVVCVPRVISAEETDKAGFMLNAMAALSEVTTFPTYVEKLLELKKSPDPDSTRVLKTVFSNLTFDFIYSYYVSHFPRQFTALVYEQNTGKFSSVSRSYKIALDVAIEDLEEAFSNHND